MIGQRVAALRKAAKLTQADLAHRSGLHPQTISDIERDANEPMVTTVQALARGLDVTVADLLDGEPEPEAVTTP